MPNSDPVASITAAYMRDREQPEHPVTLASEIPLSYEAITTQWLTSVLCKDHPTAEVVSHRLGAVDDGTSNRRKITVKYNVAGEQARLPEALFCKASHGLANRILMGVAGTATSEAAFYTHIRPGMQIECPLGYHAAVDPESFNSIIVLGDISDSVTEFCNHKTVMTLERVRSQMRVLAVLHGRFFGKAETASGVLAHFRSWPEYVNNTLMFGLQDASTQGFLDGEEVIPSRLFERHREIWPATLESLVLHDRYPKTLAHGDVHLKNWYVAGNGEMGLADWQCLNRGHWARDFAYALSTALTVEDRRSWEKELLTYYLDLLQAAGGPAIPFDEARKYYRQQLMTALTWWTATLHPPQGLPDMQPRDTSLEFIRRIATAMDDVDTLDAFG